MNPHGAEGQRLGAGRPPRAGDADSGCLLENGSPIERLRLLSSQKKTMTNPLPKQSTNAALAPGPQGRAVGLDVHPDSFAAAILEGRDPLRARIIHSVTRQPLEALSAWAARQTTAADVLILEASANSFAIAER